MAAIEYYAQHGDCPICRGEYPEWVCDSMLFW